MKGIIRKEILYVLSQSILILEIKEAKDLEQLKDLSEHAIDDVAIHKDMDLVSITVLVYSIYKIIPEMKDDDYKDLLTELKNAKQNLESNNLGRYNRNVKSMFDIVRNSNAQIKVHLQDVMQAAKIKKSASLLHRGLSIGQAAGLMGLSNWDLQQYVGRTTYLAQHHEIIPATKRVLTALQLFRVKKYE